MKLSGTIIDDLKILDGIGKGGMSIVHRAVNIKNKKDAAVKILKPGYGKLIATLLKNRMANTNTFIVGYVHFQLVINIDPAFSMPYGCIRIIHQVVFLYQFFWIHIKQHPSFYIRKLPETNLRMPLLPAMYLHHQ